MARKSGATDLVEQLAFYGAYHTAPLNVAIHVIFVPLIFATALVLLHALPHPSLLDVAVPLPALLGLGPETLVQLTPSFLISACYAGYFVLLEPFAGALYAPLLLAIGHLSNVYSSPHAMRVAGAVHVVSWISQFIGHGVGRKPALFDSLFQSIVLAVFFVFLEVLFAVGYRPALHKQVQNKVGIAVTEYRRGLASKNKSKTSK